MRSISNEVLNCNDIIKGHQLHFAITLVTRSAERVMKDKLKQFVRDYIFGAGGLVIMTGVVSFAVYPTIGRVLGIEEQGRVLFYMAIAGLLASTFGSGANYARMRHHAEEGSTKNGEYNIFLLLSFIPIALITLLFTLLRREKADFTLFFVILLIFLTNVRQYLDVEYRLKKNFTKFFFYYFSIACGYAAGLLLFYFLYASWILVFGLGEIFGILYVFMTGKVLRPPFFEKTEKSGAHYRTMTGISASFFLSDFVSASDRLLFPVLLTNGDELTSIYYYSSLVGKMMSLLSSPLNGVLSGYLANEKGNLRRKRFAQIILIMLGVWIIVTALALAGSHVFVWLFYRDFYEAARRFFLIANAGQVLYFICNTMMVIVLRYMKERVQIIASAGHTAFFLLVTIPLIRAFGIRGMAWGILSANVLKFVLYSILGLLSPGGENHEKE